MLGWSDMPGTTHNSNTKSTHIKCHSLDFRFMLPVRDVQLQLDANWQ